MEVYLAELLRFFDGDDEEAGRHSKAVRAMVGEELAMGLLTRCLGECGFSDVRPLGLACTAGTKKGKRLDGWIRADSAGRRTLFQVEVKHWCALSVGGCRLAVDAAPTDLQFHLQRTWARYWNDDTRQPRPKGLQKVLSPMQVPAVECDLVEPVACVWDALHPNGELTPWFPVDVSSTSFPRLWWFSMSSYLRTELMSGLEVLTLDLPRLDERLAKMGAMLGLHGERPELD